MVTEMPEIHDGGKFMKAKKPNAPCGNFAHGGWIFIGLVLIANAVAASGPTGSNRGGYAEHFVPAVLSGTITGLENETAQGVDGSVSTPGDHFTESDGADGAYTLYLSVAGIYVVLAEGDERSVSHTVDLTGTPDTPTLVNPWVGSSDNFRFDSLTVRPDGVLGLKIRSHANVTHTIERSADPQDEWTPAFLGNTDQDGELEFDDADAATRPRQFYRAR